MATDWWALPLLNDQQPEKTPRPNPPRRNEKIQVARYRTLRDRIHDGPIYTVLGHGVRVGKALPPAAATFNPFEDQPTYSSQKFRKHRHKLPQLHTRPYGKSELRPTTLKLGTDRKLQSWSSSPKSCTPR